jgi:hypothetical protein
MSPFADSDQDDGHQVLVSNTGFDMDLWTAVTGQEQIEGGLSSAVDAVEQNASGTPASSVEFKSHGTENKQAITPHSGMINGEMTDHQKEEFARLGTLIEEDGEIIMAGCNVGEDYLQHHQAGTSRLDDIAEASQRSVKAGVAIQLPFDGIEGSSITVHPDGTFDYDTSSSQQLYDVSANGISDLAHAALDEGQSWSDTFSDVARVGGGMASDYFDIGKDMVMGTQNAEGWKPPGT